MRRALMRHGATHSEWMSVVHSEEEWARGGLFARDVCASLARTKVTLDMLILHEDTAKALCEAGVRALGARMTASITVKKLQSNENIVEAATQRKKQLLAPVDIDDHSSDDIDADLYGFHADEWMEPHLEPTPLDRMQIKKAHPTIRTTLNSALASLNTSPILVDDSGDDSCDDDRLELEAAEKAQEAAKEKVLAIKRKIKELSAGQSERRARARARA